MKLNAPALLGHFLIHPSFTEAEVRARFPPMKEWRTTMGRAHETALKAAQYVRKSTTEHQRYSIENQKAAIQTYAASRNIEIVQTYADAGKSGLKVGNRNALKQLLLDVQSGGACYRAILVYDVSRWGRFQDADESAYYEYACKRAGIAVHYCAELFDNDGTPLSALLKGIKRTMAGEYSRELGVKVFAGQRNIVQRGFRLGSRAGYGFRRMLVDAAGRPKQLLKPGERKSISTDRVILVPGPVNERKVVRWIFMMFARGTYETAIARLLNQRRVPNGLNTPWNDLLVRRIVANPKYTGENVWNRSTQRLGQTVRKNPPSEWIRSAIRFEGIIGRRLFDRAQDIIAKRRERVPNEEILNRLRKLLKKHGRITLRLIDADKNLPSSSGVFWRFGGVSKAYRLIGVKPRWSIAWVEVNQRLRDLRSKAVENVRRMLEARGDNVALKRAGRNAALLLNNQETVYFILTRCRTGRWGGPQWRIRLDKNAGAGAAVVLCMDKANEGIDAYYFFPSTDLLLNQREMKEKDLPDLDRYRIPRLSALYTLV